LYIDVKLVVNNEQNVDPRDPSNPSERIDVSHIQNRFDRIMNGRKLNSDVESGFKNTLVVQLGNYPRG
jgi:hypothetical protein